MIVSSIFFSVCKIKAYNTRFLNMSYLWAMLRSYKFISEIKTLSLTISEKKIPHLCWIMLISYSNTLLIKGFQSTVWPCFLNWSKVIPCLITCWIRGFYLNSCQCWLLEYLKFKQKSTKLSAFRFNIVFLILMSSKQKAFKMLYLMVSTEDCRSLVCDNSFIFCSLSSLSSS